MAAATVEDIATTGCPYIEVVRLELADTETYQTQKFRFIEGAILCVNKDEDRSVNVEDDDSSAINGAQDGVIMNVDSLTANSTVSLLLFGRR